MIAIDGSMGEGGGQVLRTSLALSAVTGKPFRIEGIRSKRQRPGLLRQHLTAVRAIAEVCGARVTGDELSSLALTFEPHAVRHGEYRFAVGTAGSATLVFQTVLPPLLAAEGRSRLIFEGGTHNPMAPPFEFIVQTFLPLLHRMGASVAAELERPGFYPAGGGRFTVEIAGGAPLERLALLERGAIESVRVRAVVSQIPDHVATREVKVLADQLADLPLSVESARVEAAGPGNVVLVTIRAASVTETFTGFGAVGVPVGEHLADQLLLPLALARGGGEFRTAAPSLHTRTNVAVIDRFLSRRVVIDERDGFVCKSPVCAS